MFHSSFAIGAFIAPLLCQEFNLKLYIDFADRHVGEANCVGDRFQNRFNQRVLIMRNPKIVIFSN